MTNITMEGKNLFLFIKKGTTTKFVGSANQISIDMSSEEKSYRTDANGIYSSKSPGSKSISISVDGIMDIKASGNTTIYDHNDFIADWNADARITLCTKSTMDAVTTGNVLTCVDGYIGKVSDKHQNGENSTYNVSFFADGAMYTVTI